MTRETMPLDTHKQVSEKDSQSTGSAVSQATECTDIQHDSDCINSSNSPPVPKVRRKVDPKNEPEVKPGTMLEDDKFTQS